MYMKNLKIYNEIFLRNINLPNVFYILAEYEDNIIGYVSLYIQELLHHNGAVAEVQELFVDKDMRSGASAADRLMQQKKQQLKRNA